ncbi:MAG: FGGY-family carbohydrate kinase [Planctomycetia bacterium]|nr:FGGY-family carbohydrate kinase [Planctomycetia bacterium]
MTKDLLLAHDLGTSGNKATLFDQSGRLVRSVTVSYEHGTRYYNGSWAEQNPHDWWHAVCQSTQMLLEGIEKERIAVVSLSGQMMGATPLDSEGRVLFASMIYCDQRGEEQTQTFAKRFDPERFYRITGHRLASVYALSKILWLRETHPEIYAEMTCSCAAKDYINFRLTGVLATDASDASGMNAYDLEKACWSEEILSAANLSETIFPKVAASASILGEVTPEAAEATGLAPGTPVAVGGGDGCCAGVGVGSVSPGHAYNYLGSSSWIGVTTDKPLLDPGMRTMTWAHCVPGLFHPTGSVQTAGSSYAWLKNTFCEEERAESEKTGRDVYELINEKIATAPVGSGNVFFLPYMLGERSPRWNPNARGAFIGMNLETSRGHMLRSVLEGITMNLGLIVRIMREQIPLKDMRVIGGGAKGAIWRQIMADVYDCPIHKLNVLEEATSMGAAVIGGVAVGMFDDFSAIERFIRVDDIIEPNAEHVAIYQRLLPVFDQCYHALVPVYDELARLPQGRS